MFRNTHLQQYFYYHSEHLIVLMLYIYIVIYFYSPYSFPGFQKKL